MAKRKRKVWTENQVVTKCLAIAGAAEVIFIVVEALIGTPPLGGSEAAQLGVVLGCGLASAEIIIAVRMMVRSLRKSQDAKPFNRVPVAGQETSAAESGA